jgi:replicative DNA helicase
MATRDVSAGKIPPQSTDAEMSLLGAILIDEEVIADVSEQVTIKDFYDKRHTIIFTAINR